MASTRSICRYFTGILFVVLLFVFGFILRRQFSYPFPSSKTLVLKENAIQDVGGVLLGMRRAAADLAFLQMLQYYGMRKIDEHEGHSHVDGDEHSSVESYGKLLEYGQRILRLDPSFHESVLFISSTLAYNERRLSEALDILEEAKRYDPKFWRYDLYIAAIGYRQSFRLDYVARLLEQAIEYPDCPPLVMNLLANIYKKMGNYPRAAQIYFLMLDRTRDPAYQDHAQRKLEELSKYFPIQQN